MVAKYCWLAFLLFWSVSLRALASDDAEARSLVEAYQAQLEAWQTGDVLFRVERHMDARNKAGVGKFEEKVSYYRYVFDKPNGRYLFYGVESIKRGAVAAPGEAAMEKPQLNRNAFLWTKDQRLVREFPNRAYRAKVKNIDELRAMSVFSASNIENIGFGCFDGSNQESGRLAAAAMAGGASKNTISRGVDDAIAVNFSFPPIDHQIRNAPATMAKQINAESHWRWDERLLAPVAVSLHQVGEFRGRTYRLLHWKEEIEWREEADTIIPTRIVRVTPGADRVGEELVKYEARDEIQFKWFSFNQPLDEKMFAVNIDVQSNLDPLVDPKLIDPIHAAD